MGRQWGPRCGGDPHQHLSHVPAPWEGVLEMLLSTSSLPGSKDVSQAREPARPHPAHELQNNPHCGMGTGSGTAAFLPLPASTIPAMLLPWHPALEPSSPLPPGTLWVLAAPRAGLGTLYAQPRLGRERRNPLSRMCSGAVRRPGWGCAGAIFIWGKMRLTS